MESLVTRLARHTFPFLVAVCLFSLLSGLGLIFGHLRYQSANDEIARRKMTSLTAKAVQEIDTLLRDAMAVADAVAEDLSTRKIEHAEAWKRLTEALPADPHLYGVSISYAPFAFDAGRRLYAPYCFKEGQTLKTIQLEESYDYTLPSFEWFDGAIRAGSRWCEPYFDEGAGETLMITYSAVIRGTDLSPAGMPAGTQPAGSVPGVPGTGSANPRGVVTVDISMDQIRAVVEALDLGPSGYGSLISRKGAYLYHPISDFVLHRKTILEVAEEKQDQDRIQVWQRLAEGKSGLLEHRSTTTGQQAWLAFQSIPVNGLALVNTFLQSDVELDPVLLRRQKLAILLTLVAFLLSGSGILLKAYEWDETRLWATALLWAVILAGGCGAIWAITLQSVSARDINGVPILDRSSLHRLMKAYEKKCKDTRAEPPVFIPTGVLIDSIRFTGPSDLMLTGYVWQTYQDSFHRGLKREFSIPEAADVRIEETFRHREKDQEIVRWHFQAVFRQNLTFAHYPLEREEVSMTLIHKDFDHNTVLVPDLTAYPITAPVARPGLDRGLFLSGWGIQESYFELRKKTFETSFGMPRKVLKEDFPALHFNLRIQRNFLNSFISNMTSLIIIGMMLFFVLILSGKVDPGRLLSICVGMFFVVAIGHVNLRGKLEAQQLFYLEYFYLTTYLALLWTSIIVIIGMNEHKQYFQGFLQRDNLLSRLAYWPTLMGLVFLITFAVFF